MKKVFASWLCLGWLLCGCTTKPDLLFEDDLVRIHQTISRLPHGWDRQTLEVAGRRFKNLYSAKYVLIREWSSIIFVTNKEGSDYLIHIFDLNSKNDQIIKSEIPFGSGLENQNNERASWRLKEVKGDKAFFETTDRNKNKLVYEVDRVEKICHQLN